MRNLVKLLAVLALVTIIIATFRASYPASALDASLCPGPGNNLIENISPNVLANLRQAYGEANCWLPETFLFRPNDLTAEKLSAFLSAAARNRILPVIRIGSENSGDDWPAISPSQAAGFAAVLSSVQGNFPRKFYVQLGNEINLNNEWGGTADPASYARSLLPFAQALNSSTNVGILVPPLSLAAGTPAGFFYGQLYLSLQIELTRGITDPLEVKRITDDWIAKNLAGFSLNLYGNNAGEVVTGANLVASALATAGFLLPGVDQMFVVTELGHPGGAVDATVGSDACNFLAAIRADAQLGNKFIIGTIYSRGKSPDDPSRYVVHAYFYPSGSCQNPSPYEKDKVNLGGSASLSSFSNPSSGGLNFPPLGTLQSCPSEDSVQKSACSPVGISGQKCVSECSEPVTISTDLTVGPSSLANCLRTGQCLGNLSILGNQIGQPYTRQLADYFENVAPKLLPPEVQNKLKCDFINYVKDRVARKLNTKYIDFKIQNIPVTELSCDPTAAVWPFVPLFPDDNSLGEIQFVNPKVFTSQSIKVSLPDVQRLAAVTGILQQALIPANPPKIVTYGQAVQPYSSSGLACTPTPSLSDAYSSGEMVERAVTCNLSALPGNADSKICVLSPQGQVQCGQQQPAASGQVSGERIETVQVRTVFPYFYDIADQTISEGRGLLRLFKSQDVGPYAPIPVAIGDVHYQLSYSSGLAIDDTGHKQSGWQIFFYKLGGVLNARDFVLKLLNPPSK